MTSPFLSWQLDGLELNKTVLDTIEAKKLAQRLREVTGHTDHYFSQDVRVTARLLAHLLAFESHQQGFGLTATQDAHFNEVRLCPVLPMPWAWIPAQGLPDPREEKALGSLSLSLSFLDPPPCLLGPLRAPGQTSQACPVPSHVLTWLGPHSSPSSQNLLWAGSALLAPETGDLWAALGQRAPGASPGSAGLVRHLEEYAATLARNMELTYLNPVGLVTPNISMWRVGRGGEGQGPERSEGPVMSTLVAGGWAATPSALCSSKEAVGCGT